MLLHSLFQTNTGAYTYHTKREYQKRDTSSGIVKPRKYKVSILFVNCLPLHKDHWLLGRHPHQSQMQFPVTHCAMYVSQICCVYPTDWKKHYTNDLLHSILVLFISTAMLGLYIGTKLPFMNELTEGFNLSAELIETAAIVTTERKRQRVIVLKASPSASDYKSKKTTTKKQLTLWAARGELMWIKKLPFFHKVEKKKKIANSVKCVCICCVPSWLCNKQAGGIHLFHWMTVEEMDANGNSG